MKISCLVIKYIGFKIGNKSRSGSFNTDPFFSSLSASAANSANATSSSAASTSSTDQSVILTDSLARELGLSFYFEQVRRAFQDILKTLDCTVGRPFLLTRPDNFTTNTTSSSIISGSDLSSENVTLNLSTANQAANSTSTQANASLDANTIITSTDSGQYALLLYNADNKPRLSLLRTCIALIPRMMPLFREQELVEILARLTLHMDEELKSLAFNALRSLMAAQYATSWRRSIFAGLTALVLRDIAGETHPQHAKLIDQTLKIILQLISVWKQALQAMKTTDINHAQLEDTCQILFHLEGFAVFNLCHASVPRRRFACVLLRECKLVGEQTRCFTRTYARHAYALDVLNAGAVHTLRRMHMQCFASPAGLRPDLAYLVEQSATWETNVLVNTTNYSYMSETNYLASYGTGGVNPVTTQSTTTLASSASSTSLNQTQPSVNMLSQQIIAVHNNPINSNNSNPVMSSNLPGMAASNKLRTSSLSTYNSAGGVAVGISTAPTLSGSQQHLPTIVATGGFSSTSMGYF